MSLTDQRVDVTPVAPPPTVRRSRRRTVLVMVVLAAAVLALLSQGLLHNLDYFETVDQAVAQSHSLGSSDFRLEGVVAPGTIERTSTGARFFLEGNVAHEIFVVAAGQPPQLFQANIPVVVNGHFAPHVAGLRYVFDANQIIVKHSASYVAQHPGRVRAPNGTTR